MKSTKFFTTDIEYIIRIYEGGVSLNKILTENGLKSDISYYMKRKIGKQPKEFHVTAKPLNVIKQIILLSSNENDIVLDCFMGSGSTGVACRQTNRKFIGIELDEKYFDIAKERIEQVKNVV